MIIITGASWAVGEYDNNSELSGPGVAQYISLHDRVCNLSAGGLSNRESLERLDDFLNRYKIDSRDSIYWIVTCPLHEVDFESIKYTQSLTDTAISILKDDFVFANTIAEKSDKKIKLVGGLCDLFSIDCAVPSQLEVAVPSWGALIDAMYPVNWLTPDPAHWVNLGQNFKTNRKDLIEEWLLISQNIDSKINTWKKLEGNGFRAYHPDRWGHKILRDYLFPEWSHKC